MNREWSSIANSRVDAELFVTNITDRLYYVNGGQSFEAPFGLAFHYLGQPRMYGIRVRANFGK
jgi:iron complex outermembrane receptor protein